MNCRSRLGSSSLAASTARCSISAADSGPTPSAARATTAAWPKLSSPSANALAITGSSASLPATLTRSAAAPPDSRACCFSQAIASSAPLASNPRVASKRASRRLKSASSRSMALRSSPNDAPSSAPERVLRSSASNARNPPSITERMFLFYHILV